MLDLGHIAFRRDDTVRRAGEQPVESPGPDSRFASAPVTRVAECSADVPADVPGYTAVGTGVPGQEMFVNDPLVVAGGSEDVAQNDWRLDISGVQVLFFLFTVHRKDSLMVRGTCARKSQQSSSNDSISPKTRVPPVNTHSTT